MLNTQPLSPTYHAGVSAVVEAKELVALSVFIEGHRLALLADQIEGKVASHFSLSVATCGECSAHFVFYHEVNVLILKHHRTTKQKKPIIWQLFFVSLTPSTHNTRSEAPHEAVKPPRSRLNRPFGPVAPPASVDTPIGDPLPVGAARVHNRGRILIVTFVVC